jgi:hypothetical protein
MGARWRWATAAGTGPSVLLLLAFLGNIAITLNVCSLTLR